MVMTKVSPRLVLPETLVFLSKSIGVHGILKRVGVTRDLSIFMVV